MLIEFTVGNYRSFKEKVSLSMVATNISSQPPSLDEENVFEANGDLRLLTSAVIYGANASGKSNLVAALRFMRSLALSSSRESLITKAIRVEPFLLSTDTVEQPSHFEIVFRVNDVQYRYGFETTTRHIIGEWLYQLGSIRESRLFEREGQSFNVNQKTFREGRGLEERTRPNALFLSVVAQFNGTIATSIIEWFRAFTINKGIDDQSDVVSASQKFEKVPYRKDIEQLIQRLDVGIDGFSLERRAIWEQFDNPRILESLKTLMKAISELDPESPSVPSDRQIVKTLHCVFDKDGKPAGRVQFELEQHESAGTNRLFGLSHLLLNSLRRGGVLVIDELDARIHSNLVIELVRLFNSRETNPHHAQLIFATHNTNLLNARLFRRDQVWFVEKTRQGASMLYSLVEYRVDGKIVRNDASFEKDYIAGRYGAIPFVGDLSDLLGEDVEQAIVDES